MDQDIITALRNGIENGESLQLTKQILINSGYNPQEVDEASKYVGNGVMPMLQIRPDEQLIMPEKKFLFINNQRPLQQNRTIQREFQRIKQEVSQKGQSPPQQFSTQQIPYQQPMMSQTYTQNIPPQKKSWTKEIVLFIILLILIGVLTMTIIFKDKILSFLA